MHHTKTNMKIGQKLNLHGV